MNNDKGFKKIKGFFQLILAMLVIALLIYITLIIVLNKNDVEFNGKIYTFFKVFTTGIDTKIEEEDNTILQDLNNSKNEESKKVEIEKVEDKILDKIEEPITTPNTKTEKKEAETYAAPDSNTVNSIYYNQLNQYGKIIYTKLKSESGYFLEGKHTFDFGYGFNDLLNTNGGDVTLKKSFQQAINALLFDYPELFFVDVEKLSLAIARTEYNNNTAVNKVSISNIEGENFYIKGVNSKEQAIKKRQEIYDIRNKILNATKNMSKYDKIEYIQDYLIDNTKYDIGLTKNNIYNLSGPLLDGIAVCEGYAKAFKFLMDGANIPTILVAGKGYSNGSVERHAWNYVQITNKWYLVDVTWNDPIIQGGGTLRDEDRYKYFLVGREFTKNTHVEDGNIVDDSNFQYPTLSTYGYGR